MGRRTPHLSSGVPTPGRQETVDQENLKVPDLEPQIEFFVGTFSHELAKYLDFPVRRSVANLPRTPLRPFHQLLLLERSTALPNPCSRHANFTIRACLLAQGWQRNIHSVHHEQAELLLGATAAPAVRFRSADAARPRAASWCSRATSSRATSSPPLTTIKGSLSNSI